MLGGLVLMASATFASLWMTEPWQYVLSWGVVSGVEPALWVLHTSRRLPAPKVRAFVEFMCALYPQGSLVLNG